MSQNGRFSRARRGELKSDSALVWVKPISSRVVLTWPIHTPFEGRLGCLRDSYYRHWQDLLGIRKSLYIEIDSLCQLQDSPSWVISLVKWLYVLWFKTPMVSSNVIALMFSEARIASLSAKVGSSFDGTLAERITHISHKFTFTARRSARLSGEPCNQYFLSTHHLFTSLYFYIEISNANTYLAT